MAQRSMVSALDERFPPLITPVRLREHDDAFAHALRQGSTAGAGTIYHVGRFDQIEFALVLEPEEPLASARRAIFAGMNALAETILADSPPERTVEFVYPGQILFDQGLVGGARLGWPEDTAEQAVPEWLVFGAILRTGGFQELGFVLDPSVTSLEEAGFRDIDPQAFAARFCRHMMVELDDWQSEGFQGVATRYLARLGRDVDGLARGIDINGDLLRRRPGQKPDRTPLLTPLRAAEWYDPATGAPRA